MKKQKKIQHGFIGCGKMAQVILQALLKHRRTRPDQIIVSRRNVRELRKIRRRFKVTVTADNSKVAEKAPVIWLGIKPFQAKEVLKQIAPALDRRTMIVSMMAGVGTKKIRKWLGQANPVLRIMPNTPAALGLGVTGVYWTKGFPAGGQRALKILLRDLGEVVEVKEEKLFEGITAVSGSGPAFVYEFARGLIAGAEKAGLSKVQARALAVHTLLGASAMLGASVKEPAELIGQVVSKGGTTEAGLKVLGRDRVAQGVKEAVRAAARRAGEIGRGLGD